MRSDQPRHAQWQHVVPPADDNDQFRASRGDAGVLLSRSQIRGGSMAYADPPVGSRVLTHRAQYGVVPAVGHHHDLEVAVGLGTQAVQAGLDAGGLVVADREHHRHQWSAESRAEATRRPADRAMESPGSHAGDPKGELARPIRVQNQRATSELVVVSVDRNGLQVPAQRRRHRWQSPTVP